MNHRGKRRLTVAATGLVIGTATVFLGASPASAHVTVDPQQAVQGGFTTLTLRVPDEKDGAGTIQVDVFIPTETPIPLVSVKALSGWTVAVEHTTLATPTHFDEGGEISNVASKITWTTPATNAIKDGQFEEFTFLAGPLPHVDRIVFKVLQTYSDGDVVRWIDEPQAGQPEPEHPAPVLTLITPGSHTTAEDEDDSMAAWAIAVSIVALIVATAGLAIAFTGWRPNWPAQPGPGSS